MATVAAVLAPNTGPRAGLAQAEEGKVSVYLLRANTETMDAQENGLLCRLAQRQNEVTAIIRELVEHNKREDEVIHKNLLQAIEDLDAGLEQIERTLAQAYETELTRKLNEQAATLAAIADRLRLVEGLPVRQRQARTVPAEQAALLVEA